MEPTVPSIQTPYFEPQPPVPVKTQKKGFLKNVKITVGAGVYQRRIVYEGISGYFGYRMLVRKCKLLYFVKTNRIFFTSEIEIPNPQ
jgi:hypothetical protein